MNNGLGINFFRYLKEEDENFWVQVFAKLPFDDVELSQKGALFGVVRLKKTDNWSEVDMELTSWVDEFFNGVDKDLNLADFYTELTGKYSIEDSLWLWIAGDNTKRSIKIVGNGLVSFLIKRADKKIDLSKNIDSKRVLSGELKNNDEILFGIGGLSMTEENIFENISLNNTYGYFKIQITEVTKPVVTSVVELEIPELAVEQIEKKTRNVGTIATDRYIGKFNFWTSLQNIFTKKNEDLLVTDEVYKVKRKKVAFLLGIFFVGLLMVSLILGNIKKQAEESNNRWVEFSQPIEKMIGGAVDISKINQSGAKKMIEEARQKFLIGRNAFDDVTKLGELEKKIEDSWSLVSGEKTAEIIEVLNLELIRSGVNASRISYSTKDTFSIISGESGLVMSVILNSKDMKVLAGKGAGLGWIDSVMSKDKAYVLTKGGVFVAGNESNSLVFDTAVSDPASLSVFGSNLYVLEKGNKEIFKYSITESGFGERQRWMKEGQIISNLPIDMDIDVDIWVLEQGNILERFRRGVKESFVLSGLPKEIELEKLSVEIEGDRIALLSTKQATVVFCSKETGVCDKQLKNEKLTEARDIVFGDGGNIYVLLKSSVGMLN